MSKLAFYRTVWGDLSQNTKACDSCPGSSLQNICRVSFMSLPFPKCIALVCFCFCETLKNGQLQCLRICIQLPWVKGWTTGHATEDEASVETWWRWSDAVGDGWTCLAVLHFYKSSQHAVISIFPQEASLYVVFMAAGPTWHPITFLPLFAALLSIIATFPASFCILRSQRLNKMMDMRQHKERIISHVLNGAASSGVSSSWPSTNSFSLKKIQAPVYSGKWGIDIGQPIR